MKKISTIILSTFLILFFAGLVRADYPTDYQSYIDKMGIYLNAHNTYLTARANYLASQNIDARDKAMAATLKMLQARDDVMTSYSTVIKTKVLITQGIPLLDQSSYASRFDSEISWYNLHNTRLTSAGSLDDLVRDSDEASSQFTNSTSILIYTSIVALGAGNNAYIRGELQNEVTILQAKIDEIKANLDKDVSSVERSMIDVKNKLDRSQNKDTDALGLMNAVTSGQQILSRFQAAQSDLSDSNAYLKEANQGMLQIITQIKSAN